MKTSRRLSQKLPAHRLHTTGLWVELDGEPYETLHTLEHLFRVIIPWLVMCERGDIGSYVDERRGAVFVYDSYEGGVGLAQSALDMIDVYTGGLEDVGGVWLCRRVPGLYSHSPVPAP